MSDSSSTLPSDSSRLKRPAIISHGSEHHQDLASFLAYAKRQKLSETSTTFQGTHYEYTVASGLTRLGFDVLRTGKASDLGIDLLGWWHLPLSSHSDAQPMKVLLQCKAYVAKLGPRYVRELEGSFPGAPAHWQGNGVMGFLVAPSEATKGMREAMVKSRLPLGFMQVTRDGKVLQMLWNQKASLWGLEGFGVTKKFTQKGSANDETEQEIVLTYNGNILESRLLRVTDAS